MKKIFTLAAAALFAMGASAQNKAVKLDNTLVMYMTNDIVTEGVQLVENEDTGEEEEVVAPIYWYGANMVDGFNACGLPLGGTSTTKHQYIINTRNNYVDSETGFTMPAGSYRGVFVDGTLDLQGAVNGENVIGYSNIKSMVLYFVPLPTTWVNGGVSISDYPTGRVQARYVGADNVAISNQGYREIHITGTNAFVDDDHKIQGTDILNYERNPENPLNATMDQPYKFTVNLQNKLDGAAYEPLWANAETKRNEFANYVCAPGSTEGEMSYYFSDVTKNRPFADNPANFSSCSTGYDCVDNVWAPKIEWTPETIVQLQVKKRMVLVGVALVSATEGATSKFMNTADKLDAKWSDSAVAYGTIDTDGIEEVQAQNVVKTNVAYNLAGQRVNANQKGLVIINGKKMINK